MLCSLADKDDEENPRLHLYNQNIKLNSMSLLNSTSADQYSISLFALVEAMQPGLVSPLRS